MALQTFLSFLLSMLFPDDLQSFIQPLTDILNTVIIIAILCGITWSFIVLFTYLTLGINLPLYPTFGDRTKKLRADGTGKRVVDLRATKQGEQLFVDGYLLGYKHGKTGVKAVHKERSSWDEAARGAMAHLRQSFLHDQEEVQRELREHTL